MKSTAMTNKEMAQKLSEQVMHSNHFNCNGITQRKQIEDALMRMAVWKDEQFKEINGKKMKSFENK